jgi:hypothetical protein
VNNHPKSDAATNDPKEQRSWSELSPQITMTGPADPKEQRSWSELSPQITMNPPTGMIADPERHARDSQLATCGTCRPLGGRRPSPL